MQGDMQDAMHGHMTAMDKMMGSMEGMAPITDGGPAFRADVGVYNGPYAADDPPFVTALGPATAVCIPLVQGMVWNELADLAALEKGDFKGLSAADKVVTLFEALKDYKAKSPTLALEEALKTTNNAKRENHGAV